MPASLAVLCPEPGYPLTWKPAFESIRASLHRVGVRAIAVPWSDEIDSIHTAVCPLLAWGYHRDVPKWHGVLRKLANNFLTINSIRLLHWNTSKSYLLQLARCGLPIVPTVHLASATREDLRAIFREFNVDVLIIKPLVGASSDGIVKLGDPHDAPSRMEDILIQPFMPSICKEGEFSLVYFAGRFSHAVCKKPSQGDFRVQVQFGARTVAIDPSHDMIRLGSDALNLCPERPAYARVDMVRSGSVTHVMEIELIEPDLFLLNDSRSMQNFSQAITDAMQ